MMPELRNTSPRLLNIRQVAAAISFSPSWIREAVKRGRFPPGTVYHGKTLWRAESIAVWIEATVPLEP